MAIGEPSPRRFTFGPFFLDIEERLLRCGPDVVPLTPKAVDTLIVLLLSHGRLVSKDELMEQVWPGTFVEEANLSNQISLLRKALGDEAGSPRFIETVPKRGYRFVGAIVAPRETSSLEVPVRTTRRIPLLLAAALAVVVVVVAVIASVRQDQRQGEHPAPPRITGLTTSGRVRNAALSPDGRYVAYSEGNAGGQSLWIRHVTSTSRVEVVPPGAGIYLGMTFSPDGNSIYYVVRELGRPREGALYRVPVLGGTAPPQRVLTEIDTPVAFSPDGSRIAYVTADQLTGRSSLMLADADGGGAYALATRYSPDEFTWAGGGAAWVPGKPSIICTGVASDPGGQYGALIEVQTVDGSQQVLSTPRFNQVGRPAWARDGNSFILAASERLGVNQLWEIAYPDGSARQITNDDTKDYSGVSGSADASLLATVQRDAQASVWLAEQGDAKRVRQLSAGKYDGRIGLAWTPDGRIVYHSKESGNEDIWIMNADGTGKRQLTVDPGVDERPFVSVDGRHMVFASDRAGSFNIWRRDLANGNEERLTSGPKDGGPVISPDGKWVIYAASTNAAPSLWKVSIDGGEAVQVTTLPSTDPSISPDGTLVAVRYRNDPNTEGHLAVLRLADGVLLEEFESAGDDGMMARGIQWTTAGITYTKVHRGVSNIWIQSPDGGSPRQVTHFDSGRFVQYSWTADGARLVYSLPTLNNDLVLVQNAVPTKR